MREARRRVECSAQVEFSLRPMMAAERRSAAAGEGGRTTERRETFDGPKLLIWPEHSRLSRRLRQLAGFAIAEPDEGARNRRQI
jgi:hypothetical protein